MERIDNIQIEVVYELYDEAPIIGISKEQTFNYFFQKYYTVLCFFARSIIHHEEEAKDIVQDCFCKLWLNESIDKRKDSIKSFLCTMVRNNCITYIRKRQS